jgi:hypothetical protein
VKEARSQAVARLGTFAGVFTPSTLTMLGIILRHEAGAADGGR